MDNNIVICSYTYINRDSALRFQYICMIVHFVIHAVQISLLRLPVESRRARLLSAVFANALCSPID